MNSKPTFSILMCNYNNAHFIKEAIESVINQTFQDWELSLLDDCSTDNSIEIIREFESKDSRIKVYQNEVNSGYGKSISKNIEIANGKYGAILDPDDAIEPDALQTMFETFQNNPEIVGAYSQMWYCDENLKPKKIFENTQEIPSNTTYLEFGKMAMTHFFVFDRKKFLAYENVDTKYKNALDQDWYYKIEEIGKVKFVKKPLYYYRVSPTGLSQGIKKRFLTYIDHYKIAKNAVKRRNLKGKAKNRALYRIKALLHYSEYNYLKDQKKTLCFVPLLKSKIYQILLKLNA